MGYDSPGTPQNKPPNRHPKKPMLLPPGVERNAAIVSLGTMVYYQPTGKPWVTEATPAAAAAPQQTLLFLHGFGGGSSAYEWSRVYPAFAGEYRVIAPDLIGWGRSDRPERRYSPEDYLDIIAEFIEKTCPDGPPIVVASSLTAAFVMRLAIDRPELCKSLILTCPTGICDFGEDYKSKFFPQMVSVPLLGNLLYSTSIATAGGVRSFLERRQFASIARIDDEIVDAYLESATQPGAEHAALSFVRGDVLFDLALYVPQLQTPTAILWGKEAPPFSALETGKRLAALNTKAIKEFLALENVGLTPHLELPAVTIGIFRHFLKLLAASSLEATLGED